MAKTRRRMPPVDRAGAGRPAAPARTATAPAAPTPAAPAPEAPAPVVPDPAPAPAAGRGDVSTIDVSTIDVRATDVGAVSAAVDNLLRRTRLSVRTDPDRQDLTLRAAGVPFLLVAVVGSPGMAAHRPDHDATPTRTAQHTGAIRSSVRGQRAERTQHAERARHAGPRTATPARHAPVVTYTVRAGDTVGAIAGRAGLDVGAVLTANGLTARSLIHPGQVLALPGLRLPAPHSAPQAHQQAPVVYTIRAGDTVSDIAARHRVTVAAILTANRLSLRSVLRPGRTVLLPGAARPRHRPAPGTGAAAGSPASHGYTVRAGDTLSGIAATARVSLREVLTLNRLDASAVIRPGQRLLLPGPPPMPTTFLGRSYPEAVLRAAAANRATLAGRTVPSRTRVQALVVATARRYGVDPALAQAIAYQESGFDQRQVSPANAVGTMQVIPSSGAWASTLVGRRLDLLDPGDNITAGVVLLAALTAAAPDRAHAIAGYYQGLASVAAHGMYPDTRRYVANVQTLTARFR